MSKPRRTDDQDVIASFNKYHAHAPLPLDKVPKDKLTWDQFQKDKKTSEAIGEKFKEAFKMTDEAKREKQLKALRAKFDESKYPYPEATAK